MKRRRFLIVAVAATWAAGRAWAQRPVRTARIGYLGGGTGSEDLTLTSFRDGMRELGYQEGRGFVIDARFADRSYDRFPALVAELVNAKVDVLVTAGPATFAAPLAGASVPVVFVFSGDPVAAGFVPSFARPGGNLTGISLMQLDITAKRVELLKEAAPAVRRVAIISNPRHPGEQLELKVTEQEADRLGLAISYYPVPPRADLGSTYSAVLRDRCDALIAFPEGSMLGRAKSISRFALENRLPTMFGWKPFAEAGGLMTYGPNLHAGYAQAAVFVDKILKGAKPADLPIEQPTRLELVVNLKTAKALGITIPQSILLRADEVIE